MGKDKYLLFLVGIYGKPVNTVMNNIFHTLYKQSSREEFKLPNISLSYHFIWTFESEEEMANYMFNFHIDKHVDTVIAYDYVEKTIGIRKGDGDADSILDQYLDIFKEDYLLKFQEQLNWAYAIDQRNYQYFGKLNLN